MTVRSRGWGNALNGSCRSTSTCDTITSPCRHLGIHCLFPTRIPLRILPSLLLILLSIVFVFIRDSRLDRIIWIGFSQELSSKFQNGGNLGAWFPCIGSKGTKAHKTCSRWSSRGRSRCWSWLIGAALDSCWSWGRSFGIDAGDGIRGDIVGDVGVVYFGQEG